MLQTNYSDTPFDVLFIEFGGPGDIPDWYVFRKILTCLDCMTGFGLGSAIGLKEITSDQAARWAFVKFFIPFGILRMIVVDANGFFS